MSGICAVWRKNGLEHATSSLARVCDGLSIHPAERAAVAIDGTAGVGVSVRFPGQQLYSGADLLVACDADLSNEAELSGLVNEVPTGDMTSPLGALLGRLYQRFGAAFLERLRGQFSVAIWDRRQRRLFAATDEFAVHPLVYYNDSRVFLIASRIDALLASGEVPKEVNAKAIANYLNYTVTLAPETIFTNVVRLSPATSLVATNSELKISQYWDMRYESDRQATEQVLADKLESLVEDAVVARCRTEEVGRAGAFLSGGTDSSTVVGMMARMNRGRVKTFSIGFSEERFNELDYATITAKKFNADYYQYLVNAADCLDVLPRIVRAFDEPCGNSSAIPTYFCAQLAAQNGSDILLAGDGGDELFGGNERYRTEKIFEIYQKVPKALRKRVIEPLLALAALENGGFAKARRYIRRSNFPQPYRFFSYNPLLENPVEDIFERSFLDVLGSYSVLETPSRYYWEGPANDHLNRLLYVDARMTLSDNDLPKVTKTSELAGVRPRFPFLDRSVVEFSGVIPPALKVKGFEKRYLFKRAFRKLLPVEVIRKKKHGFGIPVAFWMKTDRPMREMTLDTLRSSRARQRGYLRQSYIDDLFRKHEADETPFYGDQIWTLLMLELWFRQFVDERVEATA